LKQWAVAIVMSTALSSPMLAEDFHRYEFHEHDVHRFHRHDLEIWRGGLWHQDWHNGRYGWWWVVGSIWYFYERPVYPYPLVVSEFAYPEVVVAPPPPAVPPPPPVQAAPPAAAQSSGATTDVYYYCKKPKGYYPYVQKCTVDWKLVPTTPPSGRGVP